MRLETLIVMRDVLKKVLESKKSFSESEVTAARMLGACESKIKDMEDKVSKLDPLEDRNLDRTAQSNLGNPTNKRSIP